ncbi:DDE-type integrase/transposase/recombinase, partial [Microbulbifer aestuariivivens]|uniref:DDE-type integrase/transposase/recombinase n=1 Tax=Microbulbifer aestuariivivens TaxID=1908308 RepID=UPI003CD0BAA0
MVCKAGHGVDLEDASDHQQGLTVSGITESVTSWHMSLRPSGSPTSQKSKPKRASCTCVVLDLYNHIVVGWSMHHRQDRKMVLRAVEMAIWQREGDDNVILHSDRGSQFTSGDYQSYL